MIPQQLDRRQLAQIFALACVVFIGSVARADKDADPALGNALGLQGINAYAFGVSVDAPDNPRLAATLQPQAEREFRAYLEKRGVQVVDGEAATKRADVAVISIVVSARLDREAGIASTFAELAVMQVGTTARDCNCAILVPVFSKAWVGTCPPAKVRSELLRFGYSALKEFAAAERVAAQAKPAGVAVEVPVLLPFPKDYPGDALRGVHKLGLRVSCLAADSERLSALARAEIEAELPKHGIQVLSAAELAKDPECPFVDFLFECHLPAPWNQNPSAFVPALASIRMSEPSIDLRSLPRAKSAGCVFASYVEWKPGWVGVNAVDQAAQSFARDLARSVAIQIAKANESRPSSPEGK